MRTSAMTLILCVLTFLCLGQAPVINSFSPTSGNIGTTVTINGSGFDATPANNIVFFGAVKATVTSASATSLDVIVPAGTTYQPISVTTNTLTAYSTLSFNVVFSNGTPITTNSFPGAASTGELIPGSSKNFTTSDLDGDGKPDIIFWARFDSLGICRNTSSANSISIAAKKCFFVGMNISSYSIADYDGDGRPDITVVSPLSQIRILRNTSSPGNISFASFITVPTTASQPQCVVSGDVDADGKIDLVISSNTDSSVLIFKNTTTGNNISFAAALSYRTGKWPVSVALTDLDGDLKPDIITTNNQSNTISILKNSSSLNNISFDPKTDIATGAEPLCITVADLDADLKNDLVVANRGAHSISTFLNSSSIGNISFTPRTDHIITMDPDTYPSSLAAGDIDGDGKIDILAGCYVEIFLHPAGNMLILKNNGSQGTISFEGSIAYPSNIELYSVFFCDMQGDGKPEILSIAHSDISAIYNIRQNKVGDPVNIMLCPPVTNTVISSTLTGPSYQWQVSTDSVNYTNIINTGYYSGANSSALQLINLPSSSYGNLYRCVVNGSNSEVYRIFFQNSWLRWTGEHIDWEDASGWSCGTVPDANTDVIITNNASIILNSNTTIRSLYISPGATLTIGAGFNLTVLH